MKFSIEQLQLDELRPFLREQANDAFPDLKDEQRLNMLAEKWQAYAEFCTCRDENNRLIGMIAYYANRPERGIVYVPHVYVNKEQRGQGVFSTMMTMVRTNFVGTHYTEIVLEVDKENVIAQKAYFKLGFRYTTGKNRGRYMSLKIS